jgi:hypothetical protein
MPDYREINELQRDVERARQLAQLLLRLIEIEWTDWELTFLHSIIRQANERLASKDKSPLSTRQIEILVGLREDSVLFENAEGFLIRSLTRRAVRTSHPMIYKSAQLQMLSVRYGV